MGGLKRTPPYEEHSSGSESKRHDTPGSKKRPSRAGTRSVSTLTAAQLERKRANDREAQRAIRQRTKAHIETLEDKIRTLQAQQDTNSSSKLLELMRRNEELEQENAMLRGRLSHALASLGVPDHQNGGAPSPSDRVQMLSQPRRSSTGTARSGHSVTELSTPVSQPSHWQPQHAYPPHVSSPHVENSPNLGEVSNQQDGVRWSPHPGVHHQQHSVSLPVQDPSLHAVDTTGMSYPSPYGMDSNNRAMSYPLENPRLVTSQPMQMTGYNTPTSNPSPHPSEYQQHLSLPMNTHPQAPHPPHPQQQAAPYSPYSAPQHQNYVPQVSHPGDMQMMAPASHQQPQMMGEHGHIMYHMAPNMKVEH
ncbi:hypothetical protein P154DRAFT_438686 [Amniculicola lignicola CBS 123094]|uniref:BZIP domain-containing protein n=1 Tax=Amniculicola lignicola CBS 123094 TaxID=1392246 RepID=A0A6A5WAC4_9PLEO|nr:hypothetical protein P154DRAFT_438686 [Amniculicola lignicola CBS 123094]